MKRPFRPMRTVFKTPRKLRLFIRLSLKPSKSSRRLKKLKPRRSEKLELNSRSRQKNSPKPILRPRPRSRRLHK